MNRDQGNDSDSTNHAPTWFTPVAMLLADSTLARVESIVQGLAHVQLAPSWRLWLPIDLWQSMDEALAPTCVRELWHSKDRGELLAPTSEERFREFLSRFEQRPILDALLSEYPVLADLLTQMTDLWARHMSELLTRLDSDLRHIEERIFDGADVGVLTGIRRLGDRHNGNRAVTAIRFSTGRQLIYKPRDLAPDMAYATVVEFLASRSGTLNLRTPIVVPRGTYGWSEYVAHAACEGVAELEQYYHRLGSHLALLWFTHASDLHQDNLIASGAQPVFVDLEAVAHPSLLSLRVADNDHANDLQHLLSSVRRTGLLPEIRRTTAKSTGMQLGGVMPRGGQLSGRTGRFWQAAGTDEMRLVRAKTTAGNSQNTPALRTGVTPPVSSLVPQILAGFELAYRLVVQHRGELLRYGGPLQPLRVTRTRVLFRDTEVYAQLLQESYHPDVLREREERDRQVFKALDHSVAIARPVELVDAEKRSLWRGDIPCFVAEVESGLVFASGESDAVLRLPETGAQAIDDCLGQMCDEDLERQAWHIEASFAVAAAAGLASHHISDASRPYARRDATLSSVTGDALAMAIGVGDRLIRASVREAGGDRRWIGVLPQSAGGFFVGDVGPSLFHGTAGLSLFFGSLFSTTGESRFQEARDQCWRATTRRARSATEMGIADGWGGIAIAAASLCRLTGDHQYLHDVQGPPFDEGLRASRAWGAVDLFAGYAGALMGLVALAEADPASADSEGLSILATRVENAWATEVFEHEGIGHGRDGLAWALGRYARFCDESGQVLRWRDWLEHSLAAACVQAPSSADQPPQPVAELGADRALARARGWCRGRAGTAVALLDLTDAPRPFSAALDSAFSLEVEAPNCVETDDLCHGNLGITEFLALAATPLLKGRPPAAVELRRVLSVERMRTRGIVCGTLATIVVPGLFQGLAGIGQALLRSVNDRQALPSPIRLTLD